MTSSLHFVSFWPFGLCRVHFVSFLPFGLCRDSAYVIVNWQARERGIGGVREGLEGRIVEIRSD